ncbi:hypothetical protein [Nostoc sp. ChiSLP03a]|uniref:hypothetical protein n=1 Tax=Nostoc sp. ChiSLP03a TaxID=3075380 RepID=UPI002AD3663B|nr:hypothetical protein [Nostoc sp. ChiSLP03a]MDZ8215964.1 hypothetical protein [Nostoc sp. ChiSLP03a]
MIEIHNLTQGKQKLIQTARNTETSWQKLIPRRRSPRSNAWTISARGDRLYCIATAKKVRTLTDDKI